MREGLMPERPAAVVVAAYRATRWIGEALESIDAQEPAPGWRYELRLGVDGCEETSALLRAAGRPHWYSPENVGPYVMRNSLITARPAGAYAIFDADDRMGPGYLRTLLGTVRDGIVGAARRQIDADGNVIKDFSAFAGGVAVISGPAWERLGGYRDWRIAADHDLIVRAQRLRIAVQAVGEVLYSRRVHPDSLTRHPETGFGTLPRRQHKARAERLAQSSKNLYVMPATTPLELREP
jgi:glycosyltransferase involved in cell wall biosynthesis